MSIVRALSSALLLFAGTIEAKHAERGLLDPLTSPISAVISGLTNTSRNSLSLLGTLEALVLPPFLTDNVRCPAGNLSAANAVQPLPSGFPWGLKNIWTNYYTDYPYTGVTRYYDWTITQTSCAPDGVNTTCLLVNEQFPGPMIEANWGDQIQVTLHNNLPDEGAAIHWHGFLQKGSQSFDGVPGVSQCPIAPGQSMTYSFHADLYGSSWWHSHYSSQYSSGIQGPIVVFGPNDADFDIDLGPVQINDWYHTYYKDLLEGLSVPLSQGPQYPYSQNILVNGKNPFDCDNAGGRDCSEAPMATFSFTPGKKHKLRLINTSADAMLKISIDGHKMQVVANDFVPIQPYETEVVTLSIGQRSDVIVTADASPNESYWLRAFAPPGCASNNGQNVGSASIYYNGKDELSKLPSAGTSVRTYSGDPQSGVAWPSSLPVPGWNNTYCGNDPLTDTEPIMELAVTGVDRSRDVELSGHSNGTHGRWWMNNVSSVVDYNDPILLRSKSGDNTFPPVRAVDAYDSSVKSVRYIVKNRSGNPHPMHFHGHNLFILAEGTEPNGTWDGTITRPSNPQRRDVQTVVPWGYIVVQWNQDNPGAWPFHCHLAWHLSLGMGVEVLESPDLIKSQVDVGSVGRDTCREWWSYTNHNVIDQIDSGI